MVRAHFPQKSGLSITSNTNNSPQGSGQILIPSVSDGMQYEDTDIMCYEPDDWGIGSALQRIKIIINPSQVPSLQNDHRMLVRSTIPNLVGVSIDEIRFADAFDIPLSHYIQHFDSGTGELIAWVNLPSIISGDFLYIYYDNSLGVDKQDIEKTWDGYDFVYPLHHVDANATNLLGADSPRVGTTQVDGKIFKATNFADLNEWIQLNSTDWRDEFNNTSFSILFWYKSTDANRGIFLGNFKDAFTFPQFSLELFNSELRFFIRDEDSELTDLKSGVDSAFIDGQSHLIIMTYDGAGDRIARIYFDANLIMLSSARVNNNKLIINHLNTAAPHFLSRDVILRNVDYIGDMEFLRKINNIALSADEIQTIFNNEFAPETFYSLGPVENRPALIPMGYEQ